MRCLSELDTVAKNPAQLRFPWRFHGDMENKKTHGEEDPHIIRSFFPLHCQVLVPEGSTMLLFSKVRLIIELNFHHLYHGYPGCP